MIMRSIFLVSLIYLTLLTGVHSTRDRIKNKNIRDGYHMWRDLINSLFNPTISVSIKQISRVVYLINKAEMSSQSRYWSDYFKGEFPLAIKRRNELLNYIDHDKMLIQRTSIARKSKSLANNILEISQVVNNGCTDMEIGTLYLIKQDYKFNSFMHKGLENIIEKQIKHCQYMHNEAQEYRFRMVGAESTNAVREAYKFVQKTISKFYEFRNPHDLVARGIAFYMIGLNNPDLELFPYDEKTASKFATIYEDELFNACVRLCYLSRGLYVLNSPAPRVTFTKIADPKFMIRKLFKFSCQIQNYSASFVTQIIEQFIMIKTRSLK